MNEKSEWWKIAFVIEKKKTDLFNFQKNARKAKKNPYLES